jgi:branched-chain amino acid aminotransferase
MNNDFPKGIAYVDGIFVDISEARIPLLDWGFLRSDATYDVVHVWKNRFFLLDRHIDRFLDSTKKLRMPCGIPKEKIKQILAGCVHRAGLENSYVEMIQTRGVSPSFERDPRKATPRFMAFSVPFGWILKPEDIEIGLDITVTNIERISPNSLDPTIKNYHWLDLVNSMFEAFDGGYQTGVVVDEKKNILEGPGFNIFSLDGDGLNTPGKGVLCGITRNAVINIAKALSIPVNFCSIPLKKFQASLEVFATSTAGGVMPITKVNGKKIGDGKFGEVTRKIYEIYWEKHKDPNWSCSVDELLI